MRVSICLFALVLAACATTRPAPTTAPAACPTVATSWTPRPWPKGGLDAKHPCRRPVPTPGADQVAYGSDVDEALYCVELLYTGPDGLPIAAMVDGALAALGRAHPAVRLTADPDGGFTYWPDPGKPTLHTKGAPITDVQAMTRAFVYIATLVRGTIGRAIYPPPEDTLLDGALAALAWKTEVGRPRFRKPGEVPAESFTGVAHDNLVYIKVGEMRLAVARRVRRELTWHRMLAVVLDLRGSPGGGYGDAAAFADLFLRDGCIVTSRPGARAAEVAHDQPDDVDAPLVILVDHGTGSGAELVAATLRARARAIVVGEHTLGNGLMRAVLDLSSGARLKVSIGELLAADGTPFHDVGVEPDVAVPSGFQPKAADRTLELAKLIARRTRSAARADLLQAAHKIVDAPTR